ncbi:RNA methyltransferase [Belliella kenyensis]|uniref:RNA methyltransferase n=1 Tax=Belliella kenyensis TaxID=1472724 RepID=A0ABV8EM89_9BACT|nr:RNA methyltransferase [Belliella kenyensis]MCH7401493.1 RNA methyltransferase [Belliella kenyensis]MDN3603226.1 RNA methyltransferase [Belliella kenyensis]
MKKLSMEELNRLSVDEFKEVKKSPLVIVLDNIRSLNNVGSAFRTADAFLIEKLYLCGITGRPPHRDIEKTALGATASVDWQYFPTTSEALEVLKSEGYEICSFEQVDKSVKLHEFRALPSKKYALVFGNEVFGVEEEVIASSDHIIEIPQLGTKHSLNVSVTLGIGVWDFMSKMELL